MSCLDCIWWPALCVRTEGNISGPICLWKMTDLIKKCRKSNEGRLPLKVLFHCRSSFTEGCLPTKVVFQIWKIFQFLRSFDAQIGKICKMNWKLRIKQTPVLFCKYLRNESLDLHEILCGGQILSFEIEFQII